MMGKAAISEMGNESLAENKKPLKGRMEEVYTKAAMLFKEKGYLNTSVNEIAQELNIKKGSLYYYIEDKETLLFDILDKTMDTMLTKVKDLPSLNLSPEEKLDRAIHAHVTNAVRYLNEFSVLLHDTKYLRPESRKIIMGKRKQYEEVFRRIVKEGISSKVFAKNDVNMLVFMILGSCNWLYQWFSPEGAMGPKKIADIFSKVFLSGVLRR